MVPAETSAAYEPVTLTSAIEIPADARLVSIHVSANDATRANLSLRPLSRQHGQ